MTNRPFLPFGVSLVKYKGDLWLEYEAAFQTLVKDLLLGEISSILDHDQDRG